MNMKISVLIISKASWN